jgi:hypothetical protein
MAYIIADPVSGYSPVREVTKLDGSIECRYARGTNCVENVNRPLEVTLPSSCGQAFAKALIQIRVTDINARRGMENLAYDEVGHTDLSLLSKVCMLYLLNLYDVWHSTVCS